MSNHHFARDELVKLIVDRNNCSLLNTDRNHALFDLVVMTFQRLHQDADIREQYLRPLMSHQHPAVRRTASTWLLWDYPTEAEAVLAALSQQSDMTGFEAKITLQEWKSGELGRPF